MSVEVSVMEMERQPQVVSSNLFQLNHLKDSRMTKKVTSQLWSVIDLERKLSWQQDWETNLGGAPNDSSPSVSSSTGFASRKEKIALLRECHDSPVFIFILDCLSDPDAYDLVKWDKGKGPYAFVIKTKEFAKAWSSRIGKSESFVKISRILQVLEHTIVCEQRLLERTKTGHYSFFPDYTGNGFPLLPLIQMRCRSSSSQYYQQPRSSVVPSSILIDQSSSSASRGNPTATIHVPSVVNNGNGLPNLMSPLNFGLPFVSTMLQPPFALSPPAAQHDISSPSNTVFPLSSTSFAFCQQHLYNYMMLQQQFFLSPVQLLMNAMASQAANNDQPVAAATSDNDSYSSGLYSPTPPATTASSPLLVIGSPPSTPSPYDDGHDRSVSTPENGSVKDIYPAISAALSSPPLSD